jgi:hypothetical protein
VTGQHAGPPGAARPGQRRGGRSWAAIGAILAGTALVAAGAGAGLWYLPFAAGLAAGLAMRWSGWRLRITLPAVLAVTVAGWLLPLAVAYQRGVPVVATARMIAALAGLPPSARLAVAATVTVSALQGVTGLWLGRSLAPGFATGRGATRRPAPAASADPAAQDELSQRLPDAGLIPQPRGSAGLPAGTGLASRRHARDKRTPAGQQGADQLQQGGILAQDDSGEHESGGRLEQQHEGGHRGGQPGQ